MIECAVFSQAFRKNRYYTIGIFSVAMAKRNNLDEKKTFKLYAVGPCYAESYKWWIDCRPHLSERIAWKLQKKKNVEKLQQTRKKTFKKNPLFRSR